MDNHLLYWQDQYLGSVSDLEGDFPWVWDTFEPGPSLPTRFRELFDFLVDEDQLEDPPSPEELLDDQHWRLIDAHGNQRLIPLPAVYLSD